MKERIGGGVGAAILVASIVAIFSLDVGGRGVVLGVFLGFAPGLLVAVIAMMVLRNVRQGVGYGQSVPATEPDMPAQGASGYDDAPMLQVGNGFVPSTVAREDAVRMARELMPFGIAPSETNCAELLGMSSTRRVQAAWRVLERYQMLERPGQGAGVRWRSAPAAAIPSASMSKP